jgi:hypothetical protein
MSHSPEADGVQSQDGKISIEDTPEALKECREKLDESREKLRKLMDIQEEIHRLQGPYHA